MGIWIEQGIFLVLIAFGFCRLHDVKKAQAKRRAREQVAQASGADFKSQTTGTRTP